jgi:hypothetical protein
MAITWTNVNNGDSVLSFRNSLNTFNGNVVTNVASIESDITDLDTNKVSKADTDISHTIGAVLGAITLTTTYQKVKMVDTAIISPSNGHITVDLFNSTWTVNTNGYYRFVVDGVILAQAGKQVIFNYNINGVSRLAVEPIFIGDGAVPVRIANYNIVYLTAGSVVYIEAKADSTNLMTPSGCGVTIEKLYI